MRDPHWYAWTAAMSYLIDRSLWAKPWRYQYSPAADYLVDTAPSWFLVNASWKTRRLIQLVSLSDAPLSQALISSASLTRPACPSFVTLSHSVWLFVCGYFSHHITTKGTIMLPGGLEMSNRFVILIQSVGVGLYVSICMTGSMFVSDSVCVCVCTYSMCGNFVKNWHGRC